MIIFISIVNGVEIRSLNFSSFNIAKLYIKWDEKLIITAQSIEIKTSKKRETKIDYKKKLKNGFDVLRNINEFSDLIQLIDIKKIAINDLNISFRYKIGEESFLTVQSDKINIHCKIDAYQDHAIVYINQFENRVKYLNLSGIAVIDNKKEEISSKVNINILNDANLTLYMYMNTQTLFYTLDSNKPIENLPYIVKLSGLPSYLHRWTYDAIKMKNAHLNKFYGFVNVSNVENFMKDIYADVDLDALTYIFDTRLAPIVTLNTRLVLQSGILHIYPNNGKFHNQNLNNSYLDIDLNPDKYLLSLYLKDFLSLDNDVLNLLKTYNITLPFIQTSSKIDTHLNLYIKLNNSDVDANGTFGIDHGTFLYKNMNLDASKGLISLAGSRIDIKSLTLAYKNNFESNISGFLNPSKHEGMIDADLNKLQISAFTLTPNRPKVHMRYSVLPNEDQITVSPLILNYKDNEIKVESFNLKFNFEKLLAKVSAVQISAENRLLGYLSGDIDLNKLTANLNLDILKFQYKKIKLDQSLLSLSIKFDQAIQMNLANKSTWKIKDKETILSPLQALYENNRLKISKAQINVVDTFSSNFALDYDINQSSINLLLQKVTIKDEFLKGFFNKDETYNLTINNNDKNTEIYFPKYNTKLLLLENDLWTLKCEDFSKIYKNVPLFGDYNITNGDILLSSTAKNGEFLFSGAIKYPYKFLVKENTPIEKYTFDGKYNAQETDVNINDEFHVKISNEIKIRSNHLGFNIPEFVRFNKEHKLKESKEPSLVTLAAKDSYLYFRDDRKMLADTLNAQYFNSEVTAQLKYKQGKAGFNLNRYGIFYLYGSNFNDSFMEKLFATSKFSKGALSFTFNGAFDDFSGIIEIENTILKEYKALNNVFAFVNTVPSLVTFSVPDYSQKGLHVENMYVGFTAKKGLYDLSDLSLTSKEIKIDGKGSMNLNVDTLDLDLNLKTDLGSKASKIPIVGYILFGKKSISTSLKVTGSIYDPSVSTTVAKDIITAPLNIIKRTLLLPVELISPSNNQ